MDAKRLADRSAKNIERKTRLIATFSRDMEHQSERDEPLSSIKFVDEDFEAKYLLEYEGKKKSELVSLKQALNILPHPVLYFIGVKNCRKVTNAQALSFGLTCHGDASSCKGWGITSRNGNPERNWVPTHVRRRTNGVYYMRDKYTDGPNEWHDDGLLWSVAGLNEDIFFEALECFAVGDYSAGNAVMELNSRIAWMEKIDEYCRNNPGKSKNINSGIGSRATSIGQPPSGFYDPLRAMNYFSPHTGCLASAAAALLSDGAGDHFSAKRLRNCFLKFKQMGDFQAYMQKHKHIAWNCFEVFYGDKSQPEQKLAQLLSKRGENRLVLALLHVGNGLSTHAVGIDLKQEIIWDSCERYGLKLTLKNLDYCAGGLGKLIGLERIFELRQQRKKNKRSRGEGNKGRKRSRRFYA